MNQAVITEDGSGKVESVSVPLEVMPSGQFEPLYRTPLSVQVKRNRFDSHKKNRKTDFAFLHIDFGRMGSYQFFLYRFMELLQWRTAKTQKNTLLLTNSSSTYTIKETYASLQNSLA